jgi:Flp pilus assembly protein TadG
MCNYRDTIMAIRNPFHFPGTRRSPAGEAAPESESKPKRRRGAGQSVVEFAVILPILLTLVGGTLDFARVFYIDLRVQSATRNAAEYIASTPTYTSCLSCANWKARYLVCTEVTGRSDCGTENPPRVSVTYVEVSETAPGGTSRSPIATVTVRVEQDFEMFFPYPWMAPAGHWTLVHESTFSVAQNR